MNQIVWKDSYKIGVDFIDKEHKQLFARMNKLLAISENEVSNYPADTDAQKMSDRLLRKRGFFHLRLQSRQRRKTEIIMETFMSIILTVGNGTHIFLFMFKVLFRMIFRRREECTRSNDHPGSSGNLSFKSQDDQRTIRRRRFRENGLLPFYFPRRSKEKMGSYVDL